MDTKSNSLATPIAIVIAGAFIALALFFGGQGTGTPSTNNNEGLNNNGSASSIRAVDDTDHIFGNPDAPVTIVEYSDFECPFCARFHPTVERVVEESDGKVRWVYRHFPLNSIHPNAEPSAIASECVARLAGNDAFWTFANDLFTNQRSLNAAFYAERAALLGISANDFSQCLQDSSVRARVNADLNDVIEAGGRGTPHSVLVTANGEFFPFSGALPYEQVKALVDQALAN